MQFPVLRQRKTLGIVTRGDRIPQGEVRQYFPPSWRRVLRLMKGLLLKMHRRPSSPLFHGVRIRSGEGFSAETATSRAGSPDMISEQRCLLGARPIIAQTDTLMHTVSIPPPPSMRACRGSVGELPLHHTAAVNISNEFSHQRGKFPGRFIPAP